MWKDAAVAYLQALYRNLFNLSEKNQGKRPSAQVGSRSRFETGPTQTRSKYIKHLTEKVSKLIWGKENSISVLLLQWNVTAWEQHL